MTATLEHGLERDLADRLDELIPPPAGAIKTFAVSVTVVGVAVAVAILTAGGYLYPRPTFNSSFSSASYLEVDQARHAVSATVMMPNNTKRAVRITDVMFHGRGADLIESGAFLQPAPGTWPAESGEKSSVEDSTALLTRRAMAMPLPVTVPAGRIATIVVWFRPTTCVDQPGPWGTVDARVDFGDDAFPPFANTVSLAQDPVASVDATPTSDNAAEMLTLRNSDGSFSAVSGPLAGACEALR